MPAIYAHFRLGEEVRKKLDGKEKAVTEAYPELFGIGTHGPDLLFYYQPLKKNAVSSLGHAIHAQAGGEFFERAAEKLNAKGPPGANAPTAYPSETAGGQEAPASCDPAALSYIYGVLCHFALDVSCHGYISEYMESHPVSHAKIESELDRELMVTDGLDPVRHSLVGHLVASDENARVIAAFYGREAGTPAITEKEIRKALRSMIFYSGVLRAPSRAKRAVLNTGMNLIGATGFRDMMIGTEKDPECEESTEHLIGCYEDAKELALRLIGTYRREFLTKEEDPDGIYRYDFESNRHEERKCEKF